MPVYPNTLQLKNFPTSTLGVVTKFDPSVKYKTEEEIENEDGILTYVNFVDSQTEIDVEITLLSNAVPPTPGSVIAFNYANSTLGTGNVNYLVRGEVKTAGSAGKVRRVTFKALNTSTLP